MKVGDLVQVRDGLPGWGSPGVIIRINEDWPCEDDDLCLTVHILGMGGEIHVWYDFQLEVISDGG